MSNLKQLLEQELIRATHLLQSVDEVKPVIYVPEGARSYPQTNKDTVELIRLLKSIRRHSILLENEVYDK